MTLPACEVCAHQDDCEIRSSIVATESEHGIKLGLNYCPEFTPSYPGELFELLPDDPDPDLFSEEDLP